MPTLNEVVHRGKILRKSLGKRMKSLRKDAKRSGKKGEGLADEALREELDAFRRQFVEVLDLEATRAEADAGIRVDVIVDGQVLLPKVSVAVLLSVREEVKYQQKLYRQLVDVSADPEVLARARRVEALRSAVEMALSQANQQPVTAVSIAGPLEEFLFG
jgi:hypothetical protein